MKLAVLLLLACAGSAVAQSHPAPKPVRQSAPPATTGSAPVPALPAPVASAPDAPAPDVPAYAGSLAQGLKEMERLAQDGKNEEALRIGDELLAPNSFLRWKARASAEEGWKKTLLAAADPILERLGVNGAEPTDRAAVHYAKGVVRSQAGQRADAQTEFEAARRLAGPGDLRLDAIYDLGTTDLMEGEAQRAEIPEIKGAKNPAAGAAPPAPTAANPNALPSAGGVGGPGGATGEPPDPLELAKQAYLRARDHYVERLRADWHDADARGNTELIARRLKELEEIQKKREEQKKEQDKKDDQKKNDKDKKPNDKDKQDKKDQDSKDKDDQKKDPSQDKDKDSKDQEKKDEPKPDEQKPDDKKDPKEAEKPDEAKDKDQDKDKKDAQPGEEKEQLLTKEEVMRLLDRLNQIEEKAREMQAQLRHNRRAKVKKDW